MEKIWLQLLKYFSELKPENALRLFMAVIIMALVGWSIGLTKSNSEGKANVLSDKVAALKKCEDARITESVLSKAREDRLRWEKDSLINKAVHEKQETIDLLMQTLNRNREIKDRLKSR